MLSTIAVRPEIRNTFAEKSGNTNRLRAYAPRHYDLDAFIPESHQRDGYLAMQKSMNPLTRTSVASMKTIASHMGVSVRAAQRRVRAYEELGVVRTERRRSGCRSNLTSVYTFPVLDENFLRSRRQGDGVVDATVKPRKILEQTTTSTPPTPLRGEVCDTRSAPIATEPQRPTPDPEAHKALVQARELRTQRKAERRQRRYAGAQERRSRRCEQPSPVQAAVRHVMTVLRFCPALVGTRLAVQTSLVRWMEERRVGPERAANGLIAAWKDYEGLRLEYACGELTWFGQCRWLNPSPSELRELRRMSEASIGSYVAPQRVDLEGLRERTNRLLGDFDFNLDTE